jgi:hypothetical protein
VATLSNRFYSEPYTAHGDWRRVYQCIPQAEVIADLPGVGAPLFGPVHRMFFSHADLTEPNRLPGPRPTNTHAKPVVRVSGGTIRARDRINTWAGRASSGRADLLDQRITSQQVRV